MHKAFSSFRDPSGFVFFKKNLTFRQVNLCYKDDYEFLMNSGLYNSLVAKRFLIPHKEVNTEIPKAPAYKIIAPGGIPFISYPYEWCFSQLKDAALLTLHIQKEALFYGMSLKDASGFNIQFISGKPIFIDTLSFEKYKEGKPWVAYRQFCEQFLAPLVLAVYKDIRLTKLLQKYIEGIPLDLAAKLLPFRSKLKPSMFMHLVLHSASQKKFTHVSKQLRHTKSFSKNAFEELIDNLESIIRSLYWKPASTIWSDYYDADHTTYTNKSFTHKKAFVDKYLEILHPKTLWDIGANTGIFSSIAAKKGIITVSLDNDPSAVEHNYRRIREKKEKNILPLWIDILNPSPATGWNNQERDAFLSRPHPEMVLALAIIHHLAIANNLPFPMLSRFFAGICKSLIIEFIPKEDLQAQILLNSRKDIFTNYTQQVFEKEFCRFFSVKAKDTLPDSKRIMYLMVKNKT